MGYKTGALANNINVNKKFFLSKLKKIFLAIKVHRCKDGVTMSVKNRNFFPEIPHPISFSGNVLSGFGANTHHPAPFQAGRPLVPRGWGCNELFQGRKPSAVAL